MIWKKIDSGYENYWYMLSDEGDIYKEQVVYVDKNGMIRGKKDKRHKTFKEVRRYNVKKVWDEKHQLYVLRISKPGKKGSQYAFLHTLVADNFCKKPDTNDNIVVEFKDGNKKNVKASNLRWVRRKDSLFVQSLRHPMKERPYIEPINRRVKIYKIPDWHILYAKYTQYLKNREKTTSIIINFMKENELYCGLVKTGWESQIKKKDDEYVEVKRPYFLISDHDPKILQHDLDKLGVDILKKKGDFYPFRRNSEIMHKWEATLKKFDNFKILDVPSVMEYVVLTGGRPSASEHDKYSRSFQMEHDELYMRIESYHKFEVTEDFIEVKNKDYLFEEEIR